jgi:hypothetical protein
MVPEHLFIDWSNLVIQGIPLWISNKGLMQLAIAELLAVILADAFDFGSTGVQTRGPVLTRQVLYHLSHSPTPVIAF